MHSKQRFQNLSVRTIWQAAALPLTIVLALSVVLSQSAQAQTYGVIHSFNVADGEWPWAGLAIDAAGNLYGTTFLGGTWDNGEVFKLTHSPSGWLINVLHSFSGGYDGEWPLGRVALAADGTLYGASDYGGSGSQGTLYQLTLEVSPTAPKSGMLQWDVAALYAFTGGNDGGNPRGPLTFDQAGYIYGTTVKGGIYDVGAVYMFDGWEETVIHSANGPDEYLTGGVVFDKAGNLYGVSNSGGDSSGTVYKLSPSESGWTAQILHYFCHYYDCGSDGESPVGGLIIDSVGNLYGTTTSGGDRGGGTVFMMSPSNGGWRFTTLYSFTGGGPRESLTMDAAGNLYGTTYADGAYGYGSVFKLIQSNGGWTYTSLHDFNGRDGKNPVSNVVFDANGNLYGTAQYGSDQARYDAGVVWEITPN